MTAMLLSHLAPGKSVSPAQLSYELRHDTSADLARRRGMVGLALVGAGAMAVVSMYQMGILRHVPEPRLPHLDADKVDASDEAYERFNVPDGLLGMTSYAVTATLAATGGADRARQQPFVSLATAGKVLADVAIAGKLTYDQWHRHRAWCSWCLLGALASVAMVPLVLPEAVRAIKNALHGRWAS